MKELDVIMTTYTKDKQIRDMTLNSLKSLRNSEGGKDFNIIVISITT